MGIRLIKGARGAWRLLSVQLAALSTILPTTWVLIPQEMRSEIPSDWLAISGAVMGLLIIVGRLVDQNINTEATSSDTESD